MRTRLALAFVAGAGALAFVRPPAAPAYSLLGGSLGTGQRDVRVFDNFTDATANDNTTPHPSFPGYTGAELAIWKASVEWGSHLHGDGQGDPHQPGGLGSGGANFDTTWQGNATGVGTKNNNIHSEISGADGGVLAYCETPIQDGWRIRYYENWTWDDGPGTSVSGMDLQGVATHEYGHALGLGHSSVAGATMYPTVAGAGVAQRSIEPDDAAGLQAIYGAASANKPRIQGLTVSGDTLTLDGERFSTSGNQVWFTREGSNGTGTPVIVSNLSSMLGGTRITLTIPATAGPGDVLVKANFSGHASLSNAWPLHPDVDGSSGGTPTVTSLTPSSVPALSVPSTQVVLGGSGLSMAVTLAVDGVELEGTQWSIESDSALRFSMPLVDQLGPVEILVRDALGQGSPVSLEVAAADPPALAIDSNLIFSSNGALLTLAAPAASLTYLAVSPDLVPSSLPGLLNADIGNGMATLYLLGTWTMPAQGWVQTTLPVVGLPFGTDLHFQTAVWNPATGTLPLAVSNVATGTFYF